jgi:hypothetical protein
VVALKQSCVAGFQDGVRHSHRRLWDGHRASNGGLAAARANERGVTRPIYAASAYSSDAPGTTPTTHSGYLSEADSHLVRFAASVWIT